MTANSREEAIKIRNWELSSQSGPITDNVLVKEFIAGNDAAFTQLVARYKDPIINYLNMMVGNYDVATDLSQETFIRVYQNIGRYSNLYQFSTWIYRIATNLGIDEMRYRKRRGQVFYKNIWGNKKSADQKDELEFELKDIPLP